MEQYIPILYDLALVVIILFYIRMRYRAGFVSSVIGLAGNILSFIAAYSLSPILSAYIYEHFLQAKMLSMLQEHINGDNIITGVNTFIDSLPGPVSNAVVFLLGNSEGLSKTVSDSASVGAQDMVTTMEQSVMRPTVISLLQVIVFFVLFAVCMFLIRRIAGMMRGIRHIPLVGAVNSVLGGALGAVEGVLLTALITIVFSYIIVLSNGKIPYVSGDFSKNSLAFRILDGLKLNLMSFFMKQ